MSNTGRVDKFPANHQNLIARNIADLKSNFERIKGTQFDNVSLFFRWSDIEFSDKKVDEVFLHTSYIKDTTRVLEIDLRDNCLADRHMYGIVDLLQNNHAVKKLTLWLPGNYIQDEGAIEIFECLSNMTGLTCLNINLEWNFHLSNKSCYFLCQQIIDLMSLEEIRINMSKHTYVSQEGEYKFKNAIIDLKNLKKGLFDNKNCLIYS